MMNGSETANVVVEDKDSEENLFKVNGAEKNLKMSNSSNYKVIDDQLFTSNEWLTFALKNGIVTLKQASYFNPATDSGIQQHIQALQILLPLRMKLQSQKPKLNIKTQPQK